MTQSIEAGDGRGWSLFPPSEELKQEGQEKFFLISDSGSSDSVFSINWMGLSIGLIIILFFLYNWQGLVSARSATSLAPFTVHTPHTARMSSTDTTLTTGTTRRQLGLPGSTDTLPRRQICSPTS